MVLTTLLIDEVTAAIQAKLLAEFSHFAVGDGSSTPAAADTALDAEDFRDAIDETDTSISDEITVTGIVATTENNSQDITEVALFDAASSGNMWCRNLITTIAKTSDVAVFLDFNVTITVTEDTS